MLLALYSVFDAKAAALVFYHGLSMLHELKYEADFKHFEYVNPNAPLGGVIKLPTSRNVRNFAGEWDNITMDRQV